MELLVYLAEADGAVIFSFTGGWSCYYFLHRQMELLVFLSRVDGAVIIFLHRQMELLVFLAQTNGAVSFSCTSG